MPAAWPTRRRGWVAWSATCSASPSSSAAREVAPLSFDPDAVAQILHNLLDNAEKYSRESPDRSIRVVLAAARGGASVTVSDHGPGLGTRARKLFHPFSRAAAADGPAGLGLGLALSRALARSQGGELAIATAERAGPGASFVLTLPG
jgi:signal transduction histidine kinase